MRVLITGTFDGIHEGHRAYAAQARALAGDGELVAIIARTETVQRLKGKTPMLSEEERRTNVEKELGVNRAVLGNSGGDIFHILDEIRPDVIVLGYDQRIDEAKLRNQLNDFGLSQTRILRGTAYHPETYKTSKLRGTDVYRNHIMK